MTNEQEKPEVMQFPKDYSEMVLIPALRYVQRKQQVTNTTIQFELKDGWYTFRIFPTSISFLYGWFHYSGLMYAETNWAKEEKEERQKLRKAMDRLKWK